MPTPKSIPPHLSPSRRFLVTIIAMLPILILLTFLYFILPDPRNTLTKTSSPTPPLTNTPWPTATLAPTLTPMPPDSLASLTNLSTSDQSTWHTYTDPITHFTLKYPPNVQLVDLYTYPITKLSLTISTLPIANTVHLGSSETLTRDRLLLEQGIFEDNWQMDHRPSRQIISVHNHNLKTFNVYAEFDLGNISFDRIAVFYPDDQHITILKLKAPPNLIIAENPQFFISIFLGQDTPGWNFQIDGTLDQFHQSLTAGTLSPSAQAWTDTFDAILQTLTFNTPTKL